MNERRHPFRQRFDRLTTSFRRGRGRRFPGELRRIEQFQSGVLEPQRDVIVYVPPGYDRDTNRRYPVLYMHDGQNLFDPKTAFVKGQHWRAGETIGGMIEKGLIAPLLVVAIYNAGDRRIDEYTPTRDARHDRGGQADQYGMMIIEELKPRIDRDFRTLNDRTNTALAGSSLGGLVSAYIGLKRPDIFGSLGVISPAVWWDDKVILRTVESFNHQSRPRIWVDIGLREGDPAVQNARQFVSALEKKGWQNGSDLRYVEIPDAEHNESAWAARVGDVLRFLFK